MSSFKIVSDSSSDLRTISDIPFSSVPLKISTAEKEFTDDETLVLSDMLSYLENYKGKSHSACPNTSEWKSSFEDYENIFCITISSSLSGSYSSAVSAAEEYMKENEGRNVYVIDSLSTGPESSLIIEKLCELIKAGKSFEEIKSKIIDYQKRTHLIFALESMRNLANNGRISPLIAKFAGLIGIRVVGKASNEGTLEMTNKSKGIKKMLSDIVENMEKSQFSGKAFIHHCENEEAAKALEKMIKEKFKSAEIQIRSVGGLCGFYAERGGLIVGFEGGIK